MSKPSYSDIFGKFPEADIGNLIDNCTVVKCALNIEDRTIDLNLEAKEYISLAIRRQVVIYIKSTLQLKDCKVSFTFTDDAFCLQALMDVSEEIRYKNTLINGYLNGADYIVDGNNVKISLKHGGFKKIEESGFEKLFKLRIKELFRRDVILNFDGQLEDVEMPLPEPSKPAPQPAPKKEAVKETKISFEKRDEKPQNGIVYLDDPKLFYGRRIDNNTKPMIEVSDEDTEIVCWGEVFDTDSRTINTKRGEAVIFNFSFSDYTNSLTASMFMDPKRMGDIAPIKKGSFILVNGGYEFDNYKKEFIVKPRSIALLQKYTETDDYEGLKRVELHCHTNMSSKDAVSSAEDIINQAYKWGHKAVAITDHGVVQAYPAAAGAVKGIRKSGGDFKVIYGVEAYFVDDSVHKVDGLGAKELSKLRHHMASDLKSVEKSKRFLFLCLCKCPYHFRWTRMRH